MTKVGKFWTGAVAYISLLVGAGLSVAGNVADTYRVRGERTDTLDLTMAAGWPILVLLAIEMFVSPRWSERRMFQVWRWVGCLAVGGMAMVVSWTHLNDLMASRGQLAIVAILGPLAIDGMAIMATGLILSTRGHVATGQSLGQKLADTVDTLASGQHFGQPDTVATGQQWTGPVASEEDVAISEAAFRGQPDIVADLDSYLTGHGTIGRVQFGIPGQPDTDNALAKILSNANWADDLDSFDRRVDEAIGQTGQELASEAEQYLAGVATPPPSRVPVVRGIVPDHLKRWQESPDDLIRAWGAGEGFVAYNGAAVDQLLARWFECSTRTIRRRRAAVLGTSSAPPAGE